MRNGKNNVEKGRNVQPRTTCPRADASNGIELTVAAREEHIDPRTVRKYV